MFIPLSQNLLIRLTSANTYLIHSYSYLIGYSLFLNFKYLEYIHSEALFYIYLIFHILVEIFIVISIVNEYEYKKNENNQQLSLRDEQIDN